MNRFQERAIRQVDNLRFSLIEDRLEKLEAKIFVEKKTPTSLSQQMLILEELGILETLKKLKLTDTKLASLLSSILNNNSDNIRKALSGKNSKNSSIKTATNYAFLNKVFEEVGLKDLASKADLEFTKLENVKEK